MKNTGAAALSQSKVKEIKTMVRFKVKGGSTGTHSMDVSVVYDFSSFSDSGFLSEATSPVFFSISVSFISSI